MQTVLDTSALLAFFLEERGLERVALALDDQVAVSAVIVSEFADHLLKVGYTLPTARFTVETLKLNVVPFDSDSAFDCAELRSVARKYGLGIADTACIALGRVLGATVLTADRSFAKLPLDVEVELIC
jgi:PIN domain nuclease of toxin-antitoxin system